MADKMRKIFIFRFFGQFGAPVPPYFEEGIKQNCYDDKMILDWSKLYSRLDAKQLTRNKYKFSVTWKNVTVGEDTWISQEHLPTYLQSYFNNFKAVFELNEDVSRKRKQNMIVRV
ncbi:uncharacterized protein VP01_1508g2 [Puccinia sorghi]|uniref:Chromo domain-containing protein n=1 Tax=Puccinia sorghi TaxID=27349 RepID=A0A0L6VJ05_9BASI|nr:uncharacterized protein VP01_1508g2 [Puccinia sorghi]